MLFLSKKTNHVAQNCLSAVGLNTYPNDILVLYASLRCILRGEVDVTLCHDHALRDLQLTSRTNDRTCTGACYVTGFPDRCCNTDRTCICCRQLYLVCAAERAEDRNVRQFLLRTNDSYTLFACELSRLRQHLLNCQFLSLTEQHSKCLGSQMYVSCRCFNNKLFRHGVYLP